MVVVIFFAAKHPKFVRFGKTGCLLCSVHVCGFVPLEFLKDLNLALVVLHCTKSALGQNAGRGCLVQVGGVLLLLRDCYR